MRGSPTLRALHADHSPAQSRDWFVICTDPLKVTSSATGALVDLWTADMNDRLSDNPPCPLEILHSQHVRGETAWVVLAQSSGLHDHRDDQ